MSEQENPQDAVGGAFEKVAGRAKAMVGRLIGNDDLAAEGELQQAKAENATDAARLAAEAEQRDREAEVAAEQEANRIERQRVEAELARIERDDQIEQERLREVAEIEQQAARSRAIVSDQSRRDDDGIRQRERDIVAADIAGAVKAAGIRQEAKQAEIVADALDSAQRDLLEREQNGELS
jgi:uncharacterized protein YjbJ (UPF0337 family)